jgi:hypothetical protein
MHCRTDLQRRHCCHARCQQAILDVRSVPLRVGYSDELPFSPANRTPFAPGAVASTAPSCASDGDDRTAMHTLRAYRVCKSKVRTHDRKHDLVMAMPTLPVLERSSWQTCS